jgi:tripartite-type tricarboxylate transporter receptor subunit TctC
MSLLRPRRAIARALAALPAALLAAPGLVASGRAALSQTVAGTAAFPTREVQIVVPFAAGGGTDVPARIIAEPLGHLLGHTVAVVNRTGSGSLVGSEFVAKAPKDGHTLLYTVIGHAALRALYPRSGIDPVGDFAPVALVGTIPMMMTVNRDLPARDLRGLIEFLRAHPGKYDYGSSGVGGSVHLATELFKRHFGLDIRHVPYSGAAAAQPDLIAGRIALLFAVGSGPTPEAAAHGEVRVLAVTGDRRLARLPDVPTFAEAGVPEYTAQTWHMILAPSGTPAPVVAQINAAVDRVLASPDVARRLADLSIRVVPDSTPASTADFLRAEVARWEQVVHEAGIRPE